MSEEHQLQCRGLWIPIEVASLVEAGVINPTQAMLAAYIDGYVKLKGEGCWATNKTLARRLNLTPEWVSASISVLTRLGIVKQRGTKITEKGSLRILETSWSRIRGVKELREHINRGEEIDNSLKGKAAAYPSHSNGNSHSLKGMKALPDRMKRKRFSIQEIDWAKRIIRHHAKATKSKPNRNVMAEASALAALSKRLGRNGDKRIERFIRRMEDGDNQFSASSISHLERLMVIDEQMTKKVNHESGIELEITRNGKHSSGLLRNGVIDEETNHRWVRMPDED